MQTAKGSPGKLYLTLHLHHHGKVISKSCFLGATSLQLSHIRLCVADLVQGDPEDYFLFYVKGGTLGNMSDNGSNDYVTVLTSIQWQRLVTAAQRNHRGCPTISLAVIPRNNLSQDKKSDNKSRVPLSKKDESSSATTVITAEAADTHHNVMCDACDGSVVGYRYKCLTCPNTDLCSDCERAQYHSQHNMIRISSQNRGSATTHAQLFLLRNASLSHKLSDEESSTTVAVPPKPAHSENTNWELEIRKIKIKNALEEDIQTTVPTTPKPTTDGTALSQREEDWAFIEGAKREPAETWDTTSSSSFELLAVE